MSTKAAIYTRISRDRITIEPGDDAEEVRRKLRLGVQRQERLCRTIAKREGWSVIDVYEDNDVSATTKRPRPEYQRLLRDLDAGLFDVIVALDSDRLLRKPGDLENLFPRCEERGVQVCYETGGFDPVSGNGMMEARIRAAVDAEEVRKLRTHVARKAREIAEAGRNGGGGTRPFGYERDRVTIRDDEAALVREAAESVLAGTSLRSIAVDWNARGFTTSGERPWSASALKRMLCSARIAGRREHRGEDVAKAEWDEIIDVRTHERLRRILRDPSRRTNQSPRSYLLTGGLAQCGLCNATLVARPKAGGRRCYVCASGIGFNGCGKIRIIADTFENEVVGQVLGPIAEDKLARKRATKRAKVDEHNVRAERLESELAELAEMKQRDEITFNEWRIMREGIARQLDEARRAVSRQKHSTVLDRWRGNAAGLREEFPSLPFEQQRAVLGALLDRVVVDSAVRGRNFFDPSRVKVFPSA